MMAATLDKTIEACLSLYAEWPRRYNYWGGTTWLTDKLAVTREEVVELIKRRLPIGIYKCYKEGENDCALRDVIVFETDVTGCENLQCAVEKSGSTVRELLSYLSNHPHVVWYNGHKSIYVVVPIEPVNARYPIQREWVRLAKDLGLDVTQLVSTSAFRLPCVPHHRTGRAGVYLDANLKPLKEPPIVSRRANPFSFVVPTYAKPAPPHRKQGEEMDLLDKIRKLVAEHPKLKEDCRLRLAVYIAYACASEGLSVEECRKYAEELGVQWERRHLRELERRYAYFAAVDVKLSYKTLVGSNAWYSVVECL